MASDPMTSYEQAEAEAVERQDEVRREVHYLEAETAARRFIRSSPVSPYYSDAQRIGALVRLVGEREQPYGDEARILHAFNADYGTPALLRVIATALETK